MNRMRNIHWAFCTASVVLAFSVLVGCGGGSGSSGGGGGTQPSPPPPRQIGNKLSGVNFGPDLGGITTPGGNISTSQLAIELPYIADNFITVRTFSSTGGMENAPAIAKGLGLKVAAGCWIDSLQTADQRQQEITNLVTNCNSGVVDIAIVGSETLQRGDLSDLQLADYIAQVRHLITAPNVKVTTVDTWNKLVQYPDVIAACDEVWANVYPYWEGVSIRGDTNQLDIDFTKLGDMAGTKKIVISETGWPSSGMANQAAVPSAQNEAQYFKDFVSWAGGRGIDFCYFEMFDEVGKTAEPGGVDSHWGLWDDRFRLKSGCASGFNTGGSGSGPPFPYTPIANVPQAVNDLGHLIGQEQADVVIPGGTATNPNFSDANQQAFDSSGRLNQIVNSVTTSATFAAGVSAIKRLTASSQSTVFTAYGQADWPTWAMLGKISSQGTTQAGYNVELEIANALTNAVQQAVSAPSSKLTKARKAGGGRAR